MDAKAGDVKPDEVVEAKADEKAGAPAAEAAEPQRSAAGLPVRKPRATGITEYREFEDAPSTESQGEAPGKAPAASGAPAAKGRLSWLPGRAKAAAARAEAEAEANEPRQMPSNLSAWLDHRAKLVEAAKARELGDDAPTEPTDSTEAKAIEPADATSTEIHVPEEWVAEAKAEATPDAAGTPEAPGAKVADATVEAEVPAPVDSTEVLEAPAAESGQLPTRVPGATASASAGIQETEAPTSRPRVRAHNTSFFGARRARDVAAVEGAVVAPVAEVTQVTDVTEPAPVEVASAVADQETVAPAAEVTEQAAGETTEVVAVEPASAEVEAEQVEPEHAETVSAQAEVEQAEVEQAEVEQAEVEQAEVEQAETPRGDLNDTPIFRAMMSRWLTDDSGSVPAATSWSTNEADQAWSAAARIEENPPLEESAVGLPKRRPGNYLIPGAIDEPDEKPAAPAASRRDPEAIRRNLNRHKNGVSSARTEAQDGTHREEADVHH